MVRVQVLRKGDRSYIVLPEELKNLEELEVFHLRDNYFLISAPLGKKEAGKKPTEEEVLLKLLSIKFQNRIPAYIEKVFTPEEKEVLKVLEKKKMVNVFKGKKYKEGVYNVKDDAYALVRGKREKQPTGKKEVTAYGLLKTKGFAAIGNKNEARKLAEQLKNEMRRGIIKGVKGFDGKFYLATSAYFRKVSPMIAKVLSKPMSVEEITKAAKLDEDGCRAVLLMMSENGEVIEKKKGIFVLVEG